MHCQFLGLVDGARKNNQLQAAACTRTYALSSPGAGRGGAEK